jgi:hypothetical protein
MIGLTVVEYVVRWSKCVWAATVAAICCVTSLIVLSESLIGGHWVSFLQMWSKILLPVLWWPATIKINAMHRLGIAVLAVLVARGPWGFVWL